MVVPQRSESLETTRSVETAARRRALASMPAAGATSAERVPRPPGAGQVTATAAEMGERRRTLLTRLQRRRRLSQEELQELMDPDL